MCESMCAIPCARVRVRESMCASPCVRVRVCARARAGVCLCDSIRVSLSVSQSVVSELISFNHLVSQSLCFSLWVCEPCACACAFVCLSGVEDEYSVGRQAGRQVPAVINGVRGMRLANLWAPMLLAWAVSAVIALLDLHRSDASRHRHQQSSLALGRTRPRRSNKSSRRRLK